MCCYSVIHIDNRAGYTDLSKLLALIYLDQELTYITLITVNSVFLCTIQSIVSIVLPIYELKSCHFCDYVRKMSWVIAGARSKTPWHFYKTGASLTKTGALLTDNRSSSQPVNPTIVCSTVYSGADQRKHQSSVSLALGIHRIPRTKG